MAHKSSYLESNVDVYDDGQLPANGDAEDYLDRNITAGECSRVRRRDGDAQDDKCMAVEGDEALALTFNEILPRRILKGFRDR